MKKRGVLEMPGCSYIEVTDEGLVIERAGKRETLPVDTVVLCAGQVPVRDLFESLKGKSSPSKVFMIGGAFEAGELDAKRAIDQGTRLAAVVEEANTGDVFDAPIGWPMTLNKKFQELKNMCGVKL